MNNTSNASLRIPLAWLVLGIFALLAAGIFSLLLVLSRTPAIQAHIPIIDFFHVALVIHVNLSVLIWFLSFAAVLWTMNTRPIKVIDYSALALAYLGTLGLVLSPLAGADKPLMNNYVPVIEHPWFYVSLGLFGSGILLVALKSVLRPANPVAFFRNSALNNSVYASAWVTLAALLALLTSYLNLPKTLSSESYFEFLFWGGGHVLQFSHTLLALVAWIWLLDISGYKRLRTGRTLTPLLIITVMPVLSVPFIYYQHEVLSSDHHVSFTLLMKYGGLTTLPVGCLIVYALFERSKSSEDTKHFRASLYASLLLFAAGGIIAFLIQGANVVIPAHYHGSIVGITLAFMGLTYYLLPHFGYTKPNIKLAHMQPYIYGGGQLMHILGLAWSGGYGVQRKTAGAAQGLDRLPEIAGMGMMGLGGLISIIGGALFLWIVIKVLLAGKKHQG